MQEEWRLYADGYECVDARGHRRRMAEVFVSSHGRVRRGGVIVKPWHIRGYLSITVQGKSRRVHQLVCEAFLGPCPEGMECCHNDGSRDNNRADNLRWGTRKDNMQDAIKHGVHVSLHAKGRPKPEGFAQGLSNSRVKLTEEQVHEIRRLAGKGMSQQEIADKFGLRQNYVSKIHLRQEWKHLSEKKAAT